MEARWSGSSAGDYNYEHSPCVGAARRDRDRAPRQWCPGPVDAFGRAALAPAQWPARSYRVSRSVAACASSRCPATALRLTRRRLYAAALHLPASWGQLSSAYLGQRWHHGGAKVSHDWQCHGVLCFLRHRLRSFKPRRLASAFRTELTDGGRGRRLQGPQGSTFKPRAVARGFSFGTRRAILPLQFRAPPLQLHRGLDRLDALAPRSNGLTERSLEA